MFYPMFDPTFLLLIPALILAYYAQSKVKKTFARFQKVRSTSGMTGAQVARSLLNSEGLGHIKVEKVAGTLTDHYDPRKKILRLSESVHDSKSVAAIGVAAHETGHALQHRDAYAALAFRNAFVPVASFGSNLALPLFFIGFIFSSISWLMDIGIVFFSLAVLFHLVTLPVEFNASNRAIAMLHGKGILQQKEVVSVRQVLNAAAWTYVAAATMAIMHLVRMLILRSVRD